MISPVGIKVSQGMLDWLDGSPVKGRQPTLTLFDGIDGDMNEAVNGTAAARRPSHHHRTSGAGA